MSKKYIIFTSVCSGNYVNWKSVKNSLISIKMPCLSFPKEGDITPLPQIYQFNTEMIYLNTTYWVTEIK